MLTPCHLDSRSLKAKCMEAEAGGHAGLVCLVGGVGSTCKITTMECQTTITSTSVNSLAKEVQVTLEVAVAVGLEAAQPATPELDTDVDPAADREEAQVNPGM